jgi:hypothetical protein
MVDPPRKPTTPRDSYRDRDPKLKRTDELAPATAPRHRFGDLLGIRRLNQDGVIAETVDETEVRHKGSALTDRKRADWKRRYAIGTLLIQMTELLQDRQCFIDRQPSDLGLCCAVSSLERRQAALSTNSGCG